MVDVIIQEWIRQVIGDEAARSGIGEEGQRFRAAFYAGDRLIQLRDPFLL